MNWLVMVVMGIILIGAIVGFARGAVRIAVSLFATILTIAIVFFATPYVSEAIWSLTPADEIIEQQCLNTMAKAFNGGETQGTGLSEQQVRNMLAGAGVSEEELAAAGITIEDIVNGNISGDDLAQYGISAGILQGHTTEEVKQSIMDAELPRQTQVEVIEAADLPDVFKNLLLDNNNNEVYGKLGVTTFAEYIGSYLAKIIIDIVAFLVTFVIVTIVVRAIIFALDFVAELPMLGILNRLSGIFLGVMISLIFIGFMFVIITMLYTTDIGKMLMELIRQDEMLTLLYENNVIMKMMTTLR